MDTVRVLDSDIKLKKLLIVRRRFEEDGVLKIMCLRTVRSGHNFVRGEKKIK